MEQKTPESAEGWQTKADVAAAQLMSRCCCSTQPPTDRDDELSSSGVAPADCRLFVEGDVLYGSMLQDIAAARISIRLESYIFAGDAVGRRLAGALIEKAREGVPIRLRADFAGSRLSLGSALVRDLRAAGIQFEWSKRWRWLHPWTFDRRNHRKLLIVDGSIAYIGGFNIHEASSREWWGEKRWRDSHARFTGPAVAQAIEVFDQAGCVGVMDGPSGAPMSIIANATRRCRRRLRCELDRAFRMARRRIWLTTPYFVPDSRLRRRLVAAARRGVDVRVLTPAKSDVPVTQWAARALYDGLLRSGVRVFEYLPRVLHAKTLVIDEEWLMIGSANLDYRSLFINSEASLVAIDHGLCAELANQFQVDLGMAREITIDQWRRRAWSSLWREKMGWILRRWL